VKKSKTFFENIIEQYKKNPIGLFAFYFVTFFTLFGLYAPFFASSKPLIVSYDGTIYFPLFRYLFFEGFFTKRIDIFYNLLMFTLPVALFLPCLVALKSKGRFYLFCSVLHLILFVFLLNNGPHDPASNPLLNYKKQEYLKKIALEETEPHKGRLSWEEKIGFMTDYEKLNRVLRFKHRKKQDQNLQKYADSYGEKALESYLLKGAIREKNNLLKEGIKEQDLPPREELKNQVLSKLGKEERQDLMALPTLWRIEERHYEEKLSGLLRALDREEDAFKREELSYLKIKKDWFSQEVEKVTFEWMPLFSHFHWEDDAGGEQALNQYLPFWLLTRINQKDLAASLIFGIRVSLMVGVLSVLIQLLIGLPVGAVAGFFGGKVDILISRVLEVWEGLPTFFMLLMIVAVLQSKSIFLVVCILGIFGWTGISRFMRGEVLKQRNLPYVEALRCCGFTNSGILFRHILPNAIPPILTLLPFAIMGAISAEAGLSFLGLGEEGSCSWGVLMDEGRIAFPGESYLLWPPAILLTLLLVAIALIGDALRDAFDPKMHRS
jgi:peptide/nickel transport system permease protein